MRIYISLEVKSINIFTKTYCSEREIILGGKVCLFQPGHIHSVD